MNANADTLIATRFDTVIYDLDGTLIDSARDMQRGREPRAGRPRPAAGQRRGRPDLHGPGQQGHHAQGLRQVRQAPSTTRR